MTPNTTDMERHKRLIRFDWAIKRLLRHKADHSVLEGFLTSLLGKEITVIRFLESESNQEYAENKYNRVDILAEDDRGEKLLIEVQNESEDAYFHRMLFGTSKLISEYLKRGENYENVSKVYSINIVYFNLGEGSDYVYWGRTEFRGLHDNELLRLPERIKAKYAVSEISDLYPEYFILRVNDFDRWSSTPLDQWMYFLSTSTIPDDANAPGLREAREQLQVDSLSDKDKRAYYDHLDNMVSLRSIVDDARDQGIWEGHAKGIREGRAIGVEEGMAKGLEKGIEEGMAKGIEEGALQKLRQNVESLRANGFDNATIARLLNESPEKIASI